MAENSTSSGIAGGLAARFINSKLTPLFILFSLLLGGFASLLIAGTLLASTGCGGSYNNPMNPGPASVVVTATSGALTHSTTITLTVQ